MKLLDSRKSELKNQAEHIMNEVSTFIHSGVTRQSNVSIKDYLDYKKQDVNQITNRLDNIRMALNTSDYANFNLVEKSISELNSLNAHCRNMHSRGKSKIELVKVIIPIVRVAANLLAIYLVVKICIAYFNWMMETGWGWLTIIVGWVFPLAAPMCLLLWNSDDNDSSFTFSNTLKPLVKSIIYNT